MRKSNIFVFYIVFILALFSCSTEDTIINQSKDLAITYNVSKETAVDVAKSFLEKYHTYQQSKNNNSFTGVTKTVMEILTFKTIDNENAFYTINYKEGGFVVVSADNRVSPILAFSDEGKFSDDIDEIPDPVVSWMEIEKESIEYLKESALPQKYEIKLEWDYLLTITGNPNLCENLIIQKGPLLQTKWGQGIGYNNLIPYPCSNVGYGGHAATGCVATAMAQVMKFHQKPNYYNWAEMPNTYGTTHTQNLMYTLGQLVGMNYGCSSGANSGNIAGVLTNTFGYSYAQYITTQYVPDLIFQSIAVNKPVILTGGRKRNGITWPWNYYTGGHAWASDGFIFVILKAPDAYGNCQEYGFRFLHMNWGWGSSYNNYNGWFNENNFNPGTNTFNYKRGILLINP